MGDLSSPQSILSFDGFETRATWFPGVHLPTSWLDDMELDSQEEFVDTSTDELTSGYSVIKVVSGV